MTERESHIANLISERITAKDPKADVILFGSHARGQATNESDWDVLILIDHPKRNRSSEEKYRDEMFQLEMEIGEPISTFIYSKSEWESKHMFTPLFKSIKEDGIKIA